VRIAGQRPNPTVSFGAARDLPHENLLIDQPLELGSKRKRRIQLAQQESGLTEIDISTLSRQVRRNTREAYYRAALAQAESALQARAQQLAERLRQIAQERFEAGAVAQLEAIRTEIEVSRAQADLQVVQQRERISLSQLNALLNEPAPTQWELDGSLEEPLPEVPLPELIQRSYSLNPELQRLAQEQKVEQSRLSLLKAGRIPNLDVQIGSDFNAPPDFQVGPKGQLSMTVPLFTRNQGEISQSLANQRVLESATSATKRSVAGRVERAYFDLNALQTQVQLYRQRLVPGAQRVQGMAEESYRAGKTDLLFVLDAQRNLLEVERNYLESLASLQLAYATLEESIGGPLQ
jgi:cobalt-zinc-cadmium efflux system outer membrane protein